MGTNDAPVISVVVPTYNRVARLEAVLDAFAAQTFPSDQFEVVVVSDGSTDGTDSFLTSVDTSFALTTAAQDNAGPAAARNRGVGLARGRLVLFVDDDIVPATDLIERHVLAHGEAPNRVVIGPMLTDPAFDYQPWIEWEQAMLYKQYDAMRNGVYAPTFRQFYTGNASLLRALFEQAGGFDTQFRRAEDVELAYRLDALGAEFVFDESAAAYHHAARSYDSWLATATAYGETDVVFARDNGQEWRMGSMVDEFASRNVLTRLLIRTCLGHPRRTHLATRGLRAVVAAGRWAPLRRVSSPALSGIYGLAYYTSAADEYGDQARFRDTLTGRRPLSELAWRG
jgi:glycosyltransferase involved in cell wall biosynthesis